MKWSQIKLVGKQATRLAEEKVTRSSGNVFADLGLTSPEELLLKTKLILAISDAIKALGLTRSKAGKILGLAHADLSKLLRGQTLSITLDELVGMLNDLGMDVDIVVHTQIRNAGDRYGRRVLKVTQ